MEVHISCLSLHPSLPIEGRLSSVPFSTSSWLCAFLHLHVKCSLWLMSELFCRPGCTVSEVESFKSLNGRRGSLRMGLKAWIDPTPQAPLTSWPWNWCDKVPHQKLPARCLTSMQHASVQTLNQINFPFLKLPLVRHYLKGKLYRSQMFSFCLSFPLFYHIFVHSLLLLIFGTFSPPKANFFISFLIFSILLIFYLVWHLLC